MNSWTSGRLTATAVLTLNKARSAAILLPGMIRKPVVARHCLFGARLAQIVLLVSLLTMPTLIPEFFDALTDKLSPPTATENFQRFFKGLQHSPNLDFYQVIIRTTLWGGTGLVILFLFWLNIPRAVKESQSLSDENEKQADDLINIDPAQSVILYQSALTMTVDPEKETVLRTKLEQVKSQANTQKKEISETRIANQRISETASETVVVIPESVSETTQVINNRYRIKHELGRGAMGFVYVAHDTTLERDVALKQLAPHLTQDHQFVMRFQREAKALAKLSHPNIVQIFDYLETEGRIWIAMELADGIELAERLSKHERLTLEECYSLGLQMSQALGFAHSQGVVHRDLKPANVLISKNGSIKIMDFGLAKLSQSSSLTQVGTIMGSAAYMSPEQATGKDCDDKTDIYALGVVLYFMTTGKLPFIGDAQSVIAQHLTQVPLAPREINSDIPPGLNALILQMLEKAPKDRPSSMATISAELESLLQSVS